jgi:hypothetical protein
MATLEKKMRIQLFDEDFNMLSDRLVSQDTELNLGPKQKHNGPLKLEMSLFEQEDVDKVIVYLKKLVKDLPLEKKEKKVKASEVSNEDREALMSDVINEATDQEFLIKILRDKGFRFLTLDHMEDLNIKLKLRDKDKDCQFMFLRLKEAKIAANDKYDPQLAFGIKIIGDKINRVVTYLYGDFSHSFRLEWPAKTKVSFQKMDIIKFPHYMKSDERLRFRNELKILRTIPEKSPSKFFARWIDDVEFADKEDIKGKIIVA